MLIWHLPQLVLLSMFLEMGTPLFVYLPTPSQEMASLWDEIGVHKLIFSEMVSLCGSLVCPGLWEWPWISVVHFFNVSCPRAHQGTISVLIFQLGNFHPLDGINADVTFISSSGHSFYFSQTHIRSPRAIAKTRFTVSSPGGCVDYLLKQLSQDSSWYRCLSPISS